MAATAAASVCGCENAFIGSTEIRKFTQNSSSLTVKSNPISCNLTMKAPTKKVSTVEFNGKNSNCEAVGYEKLDEWMRDSVVEIVKNLSESPLLVHVYGEDDAKMARIESEKAVKEEWDLIKRKWEVKESGFPEGLIFVEELVREDCECNKIWGIVVQGRGGKCGPVCYLLKTSRVGSGLDWGCTHFCLMKVRDFQELAESQLTNCWLL